MTCSACGKPLSQKQARFCSRACAIPAFRANRVPVTRNAVLDLLRGNARWWLTVSDISIWTYGYDDAAELMAIRNVIYRLRQDGYCVESRVAVWERCLAGPTMAYRLVEQALEAVA